MRLMYASMVPKLWNETIETHRAAVRDATMDTTAALVAEQGLASVTMSQIAEQTGIGRATLYKYFPDVDAILLAWHERQVASHLDHLAAVSEHTARSPAQRLDAVLTAYAKISHQHPDNELAAMLHRGAHVAHAEQRLRGFIADLIADGARAGELRDDVAPAELAAFCLHALTAAGSLGSQAAIRRLVAVTLAGLRATADRPAEPG